MTYSGGPDVSDNSDCVGLPCTLRRTAGSLTVLDFLHSKQLLLGAFVENFFLSLFRTLDRSLTGKAK